jgi:hypothetical protein
VIIKGAGAVSETMGEGALVLPQECGPILASEAVHEVLTNDETRWNLISSGFERADILESRTSSSRMAELLREAVQ